MKFKTITCCNAFQHKDLTLNFGDFTVIIGPNGVGKSNLIESMLIGSGFKLGLPGNKESTITDGEEKGHIEMTFVDEGEDVTVRSALNSSSRRLSRGELRLTKGVDVLAYIEGMLKMSFEAAINTNVVRQGTITNGFFDSQAKRYEFFSQIAG